MAEIHALVFLTILLILVLVYFFVNWEHQRKRSNILSYAFLILGILMGMIITVIKWFKTTKQNIQNLETSIASTNKQNKLVDKENEHEIQKLQTTIKNLQYDNKELKKNMSSAKKDTQFEEQYQNQIKLLQSQINQMESGADKSSTEYKNKITQLESQINEMKSGANKLSTEYKNKITQLQSQINILQSQTDDTDKFNKLQTQHNNHIKQLEARIEEKTKQAQKYKDLNDEYVNQIADLESQTNKPQTMPISDDSDITWDKQETELKWKQLQNAVHKLSTGVQEKDKENEELRKQIKELTDPDSTEIGRLREMVQKTRNFNQAERLREKNKILRKKLEKKKYQHGNNFDTIKSRLTDRFNVLFNDAVISKNMNKIDYWLQQLKNFIYNDEKSPTIPTDVLKLILQFRNITYSTHQKYKEQKIMLQWNTMFSNNREEFNNKLIAMVNYGIRTSRGHFLLKLGKSSDTSDISLHSIWTAAQLTPCIKKYFSEWLKLDKQHKNQEVWCNTEVSSLHIADKLRRLVIIQHFNASIAEKCKKFSLDQFKNANNIPLDAVEYADCLLITLNRLLFISFVSKMMQYLIELDANYHTSADEEYVAELTHFYRNQSRVVLQMEKFLSTCNTILFECLPELIEQYKGGYWS